MRALICSLASLDEVPEGLAWLGPGETRYLATLTRTKRRSEWLLGRWAAKQTLHRAPGIPVDLQDLSDLEILPNQDGAPRIFLRGQLLPISISLSHRAGAGFCAISSRGSVGCDLEWIETRSDGFIDDYFTSSERVLIESGGEDSRSLLANGFWSAKESVLKVLGLGLSVDTRTLTIEDKSDLPLARDWGAFRIRNRSGGRRFHGWWRVQDRWVLTVAMETESPRPVEVEQGGKVPAS